ncbi:MAG: ferredoxin [Clostridium sp.]
MKAAVDKGTCIGCGLCEGVCPEIFVMEDDGKSVAKDVELSGDTLQGAKDAEAECPVGAITVE